jgi:hypothetical protein
MTTILTPPPTRGTITNINPPATPRCGLNDTGICCKESDTAHTLALFEQTQPARPTRIIKPGWAETLLGCSLS